MFAVYIFILGMLMGSFFNVVGLRRPLNESIVKPASHCPKCNNKLSWYELIPVLSYIFCLGKCRHCKKSIAMIYPFIELLTGILYLFAYLNYGFGYEFLAFITIASLMVIIFVSDFKYMVILDGPLILCSLIIIILKAIFYGITPTIMAIMSGLIMFSLLFLVKKLGDFIYKRESLGGGDIKLSLFIGLVLGVKLSGVCLIIACLLAFPYAIFISIKGQTKEMPFGPFLASGLLITFLFMNQLSDILNLIFVY